MSFTVRLRKGGSTWHTFAAPTPFVSGRQDLEYDSAEPPRITGVAVKWSVDCVIRGTESTLPGLWAGIKAKLLDPANQPDGIQLVQGSAPGVVVDSVAKEDGFYEWRIEAVELDRAKDLKQWRSEVKFSITVFGRKRFVSVLIGTIDNLSALTVTKSWSYSPAGLASVTLAGELTVTTGSAVATARLLVPAQLPLPGLNWRYETAGPEGTDVEQLDIGDKKATFHSTIRELGLAAPAGVGPGFSVTETVAIVNGEQTVTTLVEAEGLGASDAVHKYRPSSVFSELTSDNQFTRRSTGTFVEKAIPDAKTTLRYEVSGGGQDFIEHPKTGGRLPDFHLSPFSLVVIKEEFVAEAYGEPTADKFPLPDSIADEKTIREVTSGFYVGSPVLLERGRDPESNRYSVTFRRLYKSRSFAAAVDAVFASSKQDWSDRGVQNHDLNQAVEGPDFGVVNG